jgi:hypothetical protein
MVRIRRTIADLLSDGFEFGTMVEPHFAIEQPTLLRSTNVIRRQRRLVSNAAG